MQKKNSYSTPNYEVAIIGAGFSGVGAGIQLKKKNQDSFIIFEKGKEVGGTWRDNTYPGCACDIPSFLYSYSFEPNPKWSHTFSPQQEILDYLKKCVDKYGLNPHINYNTKITSLRFNESKGYWTISDMAGNQTTAKVVISAVGPFNAPNIPNIHGADSFKGEKFHSLNWNHNYNLKGKRVAVIGTGASAIQFIPEIATQVKDLHIFQRTAPWVVPRPNEKISSKAHSRFEKFPWIQKFWREVIYWFLEWRGLSLFSKNWVRKIRVKESLKHLNTQITDPELRKKLIPNYELGCKRVLVSSDYYPTLLRENVNLITEAVQEICPQGIKKSNGEIIELDAIIYGTGFHATTFNDVFEVFGREQFNLFEKWNKEGAEAYLGTAISGFPNLLFMVGPNSGLGHNSIIHMMESQYNYFLDYLDKLQKTKSPNTFFDLKKGVQKRFNEDIQKQLSKMVWSDGGCQSYYLRNGNGHNSSIWPGSTMKYRKKTKRVKLSDYNQVNISI